MPGKSITECRRLRTMLLSRKYVLEPAAWMRNTLNFNSFRCPKNPTTNPKIIVEIPIKLGIYLLKTRLNASLKKKNEKNPIKKLNIMRISI